MWSPPHYHHNTCHKNNLNLCVQNEPVTVGADATVYVWFLGQICVSKSQTYCIPLHPLFVCGDSDYVWDSVHLKAPYCMGLIRIKQNVNAILI